MSESDSDLDFESADEDADFASPSKHRTSSEKSSKETCLSEEVSIITKVAANIQIDKTTESEIESSANRATPSNVTDSPLCEKSEGCSLTKDIQNDDSTQIEAAAPHALEAAKTKEEVRVGSVSDVLDTAYSENNQHNKEIKCETVKPEVVNPGNVENIQENKEIKAENMSNKIKLKAENVAKAPREKQRVVLRIEKKIQEKNLVSKDLSVEEKNEPGHPLPNKEAEKASSWGFSSWGTSLLSTAASSVSTFSNQVSQGIGTVLETVESTLGAPPPEELAQILKEKRDEAKVDSIEKEDNLEQKTSWSKVFESTGSMVLMGGLDTLELIGKKTMDILTEGDPGLRQKRSVFSEKVNLSEILKEAKAKADAQDEESNPKDVDSIHYSQVFDEKQGLVHLEALEMLSRQCQTKFQRLLMKNSKNEEIKKKLEEIKAICENIPSLDDSSDCESFEDFETVFKKNILELGLTLNVDSIIKCQRQISDTLGKYEKELKSNCPKDIYQSAICSLAEFTAKCIETFHKVSELILVQPKLDPDAEQCATYLTGLTTVMCIEVNNVSSRYYKCLEATAEHIQTTSSSGEFNITSMATNLYVEAANSNKYIQDAYQMLVPVLQACLLETLEE